MECSKKLSPIKLDMTFLREHFKTTEKEFYSEPIIVCRIFDIREQGMRSFELSNGKKILIAKQEGKIYALSNTCTHSGGPLHLGILGKNRVRCPWHGACFNLETGDIEDGPAYSSLPVYKVEIINNFWIAIRENLKHGNLRGRIKEMTKYDSNNKTTFVILGGGAAGGTCAETLRQEGFTGRIIMVSQENYPPYDRARLTKVFNFTFENFRIRDMDFYHENNIIMHNGVVAVKANMDEKTVTLSNDLELRYDKLFIATGCSAAIPNFKGNDLKNIFTIHDYDDMVKIKAALTEDKYIVCIGAGFICMEMAQSIRKNLKNRIKIVTNGGIPMEHIFGESVGRRIGLLFEENGIDLITKNTVIEAIGDKYDDVCQVILRDGTQMKCDILIVGVGNVLNTSFLIGSGLPVNANGSLEVDGNLETLCKDVYAGGDIANAPVYVFNNQSANICHYQLAQYHGRAAAINMIGKRYFELRTVPFFYTNMFGYNFRYAGYGLYSYVIIEGNLKGLRFIAYYIDEQDKVVAVTTCRCDPIAAQFAELRIEGKVLKRIDLINSNRPWYLRMRSKSEC